MCIAVWCFNVFIIYSSRFLINPTRLLLSTLYRFRALGTSKDGPGLYRTYTNQWLGAINENPGFIGIEEKATFVSGSDIELTVITHDKFFKEKKFNDYVSQGPTQTLYA